MFRYIKKDIDRNISLIQKSYVNAALQPNIQIDGKKGDISHVEYLKI